MLDLRRREFISLLGGAAAAWQFAARAQQPAMPVIGFLRGSSPDGSANLLSALRRGLNEGGYIEGQNLLIEYRWSENRFDRLPELAADLVRRQCALIVAAGNAAALAAKAATPTIPIVFATGDDPIHIGLVTSLNRPGGNLTGIFFNNGADVESKQVGLLREVLSNAVVMGVLVNPKGPQAGFQARNAQVAAQALGMSALILNASSEADFDMIFATLAQQRAAALLIAGDAFFTDRLDRLAALTARRGIPSIHGLREFAASGGLMSYGASITDAYRQAGIYTGKVLKGARPADLPIQQPTKYELVLNLKTAKALGLTFPPGVLAIADEVIE
jgi:putative ABC transport system substrate-binding protein